MPVARLGHQGPGLPAPTPMQTTISQPAYKKPANIDLLYNVGTGYSTVLIMLSITKHVKSAILWHVTHIAN